MLPSAEAEGRARNPWSISCFISFPCARRCEALSYYVQFAFDSSLPCGARAVEPLLLQVRRATYEV